MLGSRALQAAEDTRTPMLVRVTAPVVNVSLTVLLVPGLGFAPQPGVTGAAIGTRGRQRAVRDSRHGRPRRRPLRPRARARRVVGAIGPPDDGPHRESTGRRTAPLRTGRAPAQRDRARVRDRGQRRLPDRTPGPAVPAHARPRVRGRGGDARRRAARGRATCPCRRSRTGSGGARDGDHARPRPDRDPLRNPRSLRSSSRTRRRSRPGRPGSEPWRSGSASASRGSSASSYSGDSAGSRWAWRWTAGADASARSAVPAGKVEGHRSGRPHPWYGTGAVDPPQASSSRRQNPVLDCGRLRRKTRVARRPPTATEVHPWWRYPTAGSSTGRSSS